MKSQSIRVPLRLVKKKYGSVSETDNAADDVAECVNLVSDYREQFRMTFKHDVSHDNPWYHTLTCTIEGMSHESCARVEEMLVRKKLLDRADDHRGD